MGRILRTTRSFLDAHPIVRRWVVPVVFMASLLIPMFGLLYTPVQTAQLTAVFLAFSLVAITFGIGLEKGIEFVANEYFS